MLSIFTLKIRKIIIILITNMFLYGCVGGGNNSTLSSTNRFLPGTVSQANQGLASDKIHCKPFDLPITEQWVFG